VTATALPSQSEIRHGPSLCCNCGGVSQVKNLGILGAPIPATILLDQVQKAEPLTCDGKVACVAANRNWEVHTCLSYYFIGFRFFQSNK
jgi:hypothetical protein